MHVDFPLHFSAGKLFQTTIVLYIFMLGVVVCLVIHAYCKCLAVVLMMAKQTVVYQIKNCFRKVSAYLFAVMPLMGFVCW